jgi:hypothetical protein
LSKSVASSYALGVKDKPQIPTGVQDLCRRLKEQLEELAIAVEDPAPKEEKSRRIKLMEQLKQQLAELS